MGTQLAAQLTVRIWTYDPRSMEHFLTLVIPVSYWNWVSYVNFLNYLNFWNDLNFWTIGYAWTIWITLASLTTWTTWTSWTFELSYYLNHYLDYKFHDKEKKITNPFHFFTFPMDGWAEHPSFAWVRAGSELGNFVTHLIHSAVQNIIWASQNQSQLSTCSNIPTTQVIDEPDSHMQILEMIFTTLPSLVFKITGPDISSWLGFAVDSP